MIRSPTRRRRDSRRSTGPLARLLAVLALAVASLVQATTGASALQVTGPATLSFWGGCAQSLQYVASGASGTVRWSIQSPYNFLSIDSNGLTHGAFFAFGATNTLVATATDSSGATAQATTIATSKSWPFMLPPVSPGLRCDPSIFRTYWGYDTGAQDNYVLQLAPCGSNAFCSQAYPFTEDVPVWVKQPHYGGPTLVTVMSIPKSIWSGVSFGSYGNIGKGPAGLPAPTGTPWDPNDAWRGVTASYDSVYPYPTPDRVLADGGYDGSSSANPMNLWPRGIEYAPCCGSNDFHSVNMLVDQYRQGFIWPYCNNSNNGIWNGPYFYCVGVDYNANCFIAQDNDCGDYGGSGGTVQGIPEKASFELAEAWTPSDFASSGSAPGAVPVGRVFAAPTAGQVGAIKALFLGQGIDLSTFPAMPMKASDAAGNNQVLWELDGRNTFFCDDSAWTSSKLVASAPYLLNGVFCADTDTAGANPAPATAAGEGNGTVVPPSPGCPVGNAL